MATLHEALQALGPTTWDDVPHTSNAALREYVDELSKKATLVANSLPEFDPPKTSKPSIPTSQPSSRITSSARRTGTTAADQSLQEQWGKPLKVNSKDNPLDVPVYKLPANDGKGAWFGRRSVHEGLEFSVWKEKQKKEFEESLRVNQRKKAKGKIADYAVRGIGAESVIEDVDVYAADGDDVAANIQVLLVSAAFPKPTGMRDFSVLVISGEIDGGIEGAEGEHGRCWMIVTKPCLHEKIPAREGYIRGQYESIELVREVTSENAVPGESVNERTKSTDEGQNENNPVEWIMITRSDPGGSIPRWLVEKGTPKSICADTVKFLDWACRDVGMTERADDSQPEGTIHDPQSLEYDDDGDLEESSSESSDSDAEETNGLIASVGHLLNVGVERFVPQPVLDYVPYYTHEAPQDVPGDTTAAAADSKSELRGAALETTKANDEDKLSSPTADKASLSGSADSGYATPLLYNSDNAETTQKEKKGKLSSEEKQLIKLAEKKRKSEAKLEAVRSEMVALGLDPTSDSQGAVQHQPDGERTSDARSASRKAESSSSVASRSESKPTDAEMAKKRKAASALFRAESKEVKELAKIEKSQLKIAEKMEVRQRKAAEKEGKSQARSEVDGLRREVAELKREVEGLRGEREELTGLVKSLQAENTKLAARTEGEGKEIH